MYRNGLQEGLIQSNSIEFKTLQASTKLMFSLDIVTFFGRFHPLLVHLPIGFLFLAILIELYQGKKVKEKNNQIIAYTWLLGAVSAIIAALFGWLLAESGQYAEDTIFWHRWLGVSLAVIASFGWWTKQNPKQFPKIVNNSITYLVIGLILVEGHLGGNLTHGANYLLVYAPDPIQKLFGEEKKKNAIPQLESIDSVVVYEDMIYPIIARKCISCHNNEEQRGGLNMQQIDLFIEGGENGPVITSGNTAESEIFRRITLPQENEKYMPPNGEPLSYDEIKTLEWWIINGADFEQELTSHQVPEPMQKVIQRLYGLDTQPKPWYESVKIPAVDSLRLKSLVDAGFSIKTLGYENPLLDIKFSGEELSLEKLTKLEDVGENITWLSLAGTDIQDEWVSIISKFPNLTRLELQKTVVSDKSVEFLKALEHLESLNLYGTNVTDSCLSILKNMPQLRRVYLWDSKVTFEKAKALENDKLDLEVEIGVQSK